MVLRACTCLGWLVLILVAAQSGHAQVVTVSVVPEADAFLRSAQPTNNFGGAGAIGVSGSAATNAGDQQNGLYDSLIRFPLANIRASFDTVFGPHDWLVLGATLTLIEMGSPPNAIFNKGVGGFEIRLVSSNSWVEGIGTPGSPTTDGITWDNMPLLLNPAADVTLGIFTNSGTDATLSFPLPLKPELVSKIVSGIPVTFYLTAASPQIGFTALSRSFLPTNNAPILGIVAAPNPHPGIDALQVSNGTSVISFATVSNWNYSLQSASEIKGPWTNVSVFPAMPTNSHVAYAKPASGAQRFYRLFLAR